MTHISGPPPGGSAALRGEGNLTSSPDYSYT